MYSWAASRWAFAVPLDAAAYLRLRELLPEAGFVDATRLMFDIRVVKSPAEIEHLRRAGAITAKGMAGRDRGGGGGLVGEPALRHRRQKR